MPLTAQQQTFLDTYVRKHPIKARNKKARSKIFEAARGRVEQALTTLPKASPQYAAIKLAMDAADATAEQLTFKTAAIQMDAVLVSIQQAVAAYDPLPLLQDLDNKVTQVRDKASLALPALPTLTAFMAPTGSAALRTACTTGAATVPVLAQGGDAKAWATAMDNHIKAQALHVTACEAAMEDSRKAMRLVEGPTEDSAPVLADFNAKINDVAKACVSRAQRTALATLLGRMKTEVQEEATFAPLKDPANTKQFMDYAAYSAPIKAERTALQQDIDRLKAQILQWRGAVAATLTQGQQGRNQPNVANRGADLPGATKQVLADQQTEMTTGPASEKGASTKPRRTDGLVTFDTADFMATGGLPAYVAPAQGAQPDPARAARAKTAANAQIKQFFITKNIAAGSNEMFDLSLRSKKDLAAAYIASKGWQANALTPDQQATADAVADGMFEAVREAIPDKLQTTGAAPKLKLGGKTYGTPEFLGQGGLGSVSRYKSEDDDSYVVVKSMLKVTDKAREDLVKEVQAHRYLMQGGQADPGRENIVGLEGAVTDEQGNLHMVMEVVDGGDLDANRMGMMMATETNALPEEARNVLQQAAMAQAVKGMIYLRDQNVVHFDIKGANMMMTADGTVKVADFGSASVATAADGKRKFDDQPTTAGFDRGARPDTQVDERFDTYAVGKLINIMQANATKPQASFGPADAVLSGAIKRLTEAMTARNPDDRPTLEAVLESAYLKNLDAYDPALVKELSAKSVAYTKVLGKEMAALKAQMPPDIMAGARQLGGNLDSNDKVGFSDVARACQAEIKSAQGEMATHAAKRDAANASPKVKYDAQQEIDKQMAIIQRSKDVLAKFGQSPAAKQLAAEMKELSARLTRSSSDAAENEGDFNALVLVLEQAGSDPAGFMSVVKEPANARLFKGFGVDLTTLATLASAFQMNLGAENPTAAADVKALEKDIASFLAALPKDAEGLRQPLGDGLQAVLKSVQARLQGAPADDGEREFNALWRDLRGATKSPTNFHDVVRREAAAAAFKRAGVDQAALVELAGLLLPRPDAPAKSEVLALAQRVKSYLGGLPKDPQAQLLAKEITTALIAGVKGLQEAMNAAKV